MSLIYSANKEACVCVVQEHLLDCRRFDINETNRLQQLPWKGIPLILKGFSGVKFKGRPPQNFHKHSDEVATISGGCCFRGRTFACPRPLHSCNTEE